MGSQLEELLAFQIRASGLPEPVREYPFATAVKRRWRGDFAWVERKLLVEVEGGIYAAGRHTRGAGFEKDCEKYNAAVLLGWSVLRFTGAMIHSGVAIETITQLMQKEQARG